MKSPAQQALILAGACLLAAAPALAQSPSNRAMQPSGQTQSTQQNQTAQAAPSTADFVKTAAVAGMFEIRSSKLALEKKARGDRHFAQRMIHDHSTFSEQLERLVNSGKVKAELPSGLDSEHQQMLDQLRGESGATFDKDYDEMQLKGHKDAVALFESYARNGDNPALRHWAAATLPHLQEHLAMAEKLSQR